MEYLNLMLFPDTPISTLLAMRPLAMQMLERLNLNPYTNPSGRVEDLRRALGMDWNEFTHAFKALEAPDRASDWKNLPLYHLIDFLTQEHRVFTHEFIPAIRNAFAAGECRRDFLGLLQPMVVAWPAFSTSLVRHFTDEEISLFPKLMQYEYCLRHGGNIPDFSEGSSRLIASVQLMRSEKKQLMAIQGFLDASLFSQPSEALEAPAQGVFRLLQSFHLRLLEHSEMEREILLPMAGSIEKQVYDRFIDTDNLNSPSLLPLTNADV